MIRALLLLLLAFCHMAYSGSLGFCRQAKDCLTCAKSNTYTFGFREHCRWCVAAKQCVGPLSCPFGKAVVERDAFRCPKKVITCFDGIAIFRALNCIQFSAFWAHLYDQLIWGVAMMAAAHH
ncbi:unnamed protein product [Heligmosomoides polygyrus]|uniref:Nuclear receptor domain-containing protein n=1 Tax=Heligmosomoides polygyrus TaxID=6339 RepID=A0A183G7R6_HELPZ|nr:unnamed protein product [Heligmosomoides polygyrus]